MSRRYGSIYKITNTVNGKSYVGQTTTTVDIRFKSHARSKACRALAEAFKKYGKNSFKVECLAEAETREDLDHMERLLIEQHGTLSPGGYNLRTGGNGNGTFSAESKKLRSAIRIGVKRTGRAAQGVARYNKMPHSKPVTCLDPISGIEMSYITANAARKDGFYPGGILDACKGKIAQHNGRIWKYAEAESYPPPPANSRCSPRLRALYFKKIEQIDPISGNIIRVFDSAKEVNSSGFQYGKVLGCCEGRARAISHLGFKWRYV